MRAISASHYVFDFVSSDIVARVERQRNPGTALPR
jgi:hypothetical protein